jgi:hypothetical protein
LTAGRGFWRLRAPVQSPRGRIVTAKTQEINMTDLHALWLPILLSSLFVFVASTIIHMALQAWHRSDCSKLPEEERVMDALRPFGIPPGDYMVPNCVGSAEMRTPEFQAKLTRGPVMMVTVMPNGMMNVGRSLALWLLYLVGVSVLTAYVTCHALPVGAGFNGVFRIAGVTSFLGYTAALWQMSIWYRRSVKTSIKASIDGLVYAAVTAATFGWLWPR